MTIEQRDIIDFIGVDKADGRVKLTISDHLDWLDTFAHLQVLQDKLNGYLKFIESGEIVKSFPKAAGRSICIEVVFRFPPPPSGLGFLSRVRVVLAEKDLEFVFRALPPTSNS